MKTVLAIVTMPNNTEDRHLYAVDAQVNEGGSLLIKYADEPKGALYAKGAWSKVFLVSDNDSVTQMLEDVQDES